MLRIALLLLLLALSACAGASWQDALTPEDLGAMSQAKQTALESNRTGEGANWANPASGALGTVTPTRTWQSDGTSCRDYQQTVTLGGVTRVGYGSACRTASGVWVDRRSPVYDTPAAYDDAVRERVFLGFGYGHYYGHRHYGFYDYPFYPYPWYGYRFGHFPYYWY